MLSKLAALAALVGMVFGIGGCNTVQGFGQDMQAGGRAIERAADKAKPK
jgi:predicted small secreted protein